MSKRSVVNSQLGEGTFVSSYLLYLLAASSETASAQFHKHVRANGLRVVEWRVLACLYDQDGLMLTHLAEFALVEQSSLTKIVDQMATRKLLLRKADPEDGRRVRIHLTEQGRKLSGTLVKDARKHEQKILSILEHTDAARIKSILQDMLKSLNST